MKDTSTLKDIFNTDTFPNKTELRKGNSAYCPRGKTKKLYELFNVKNELNINELLAGMYNLHETTMTRKELKMMLYQLVNRGVLTKVDNETYSCPI